MVHILSWRVWNEGDNDGSGSLKNGQVCGYKKGSIMLLNRFSMGYWTFSMEALKCLLELGESIYFEREYEMTIIFLTRQVDLFEMRRQDEPRQVDLWWDDE